MTYYEGDLLCCEKPSTMSTTKAKYSDIYQSIKERILSGEYNTHLKLPGGSELATEFGCSELTIKKALDILVADGLVVRKRGSGSYVKRPLGKSGYKHLYGTKANVLKNGQSLETKVLEFAVVPADKFLAERLNCELEDMLYKTTRVRIIDGIPGALEETYMPINIIQGLKREHAQDSIYSYITDKLGLKIHSSTMEITVVKASELHANELAIVVGEPLVNVEQIVYLDNGEIFEYSNVKHRWEGYKFATNFVKL
ncbi:DNA-binding transcriptional regulator, GntR family [Vibrio hangzhouensis]|uniref:DNA-binding transcriptional regulator, GntR family n=2 Tax=Vibrio hangzhouensis TaxID=462991 RepID=A0A1H5T8T3_9VIBR|nr:DNA-binding transcriptional regulator, GntR family [Vibrio hangzhouensis]